MNIDKVDSKDVEETLLNDNFTCQCCGLHLIGAVASIASVHKMLPNVKYNDKNKFYKTLCINCHSLVHTVIESGGILVISDEEFNSLPKHEQDLLRSVLKMARIGVESNKRCESED